MISSTKDAETEYKLVSEAIEMFVTQPKWYLGEFLDELSQIVEDAVLTPNRLRLNPKQV